MILCSRTLAIYISLNLFLLYMEGDLHCRTSSDDFHSGHSNMATVSFEAADQDDAENESYLLAQYPIQESQEKKDLERKMSV